MIPDLADPKLRALYDALLGRREPTWPDKAVLLAVTGVVDSVERLPEAVVAPARERIATVIGRAFRIDPTGTAQRMRSWLAELRAKADERL